MPDKTITIITPCFNEQEVIPLFHERVREVLDRDRRVRYRICFVDDGSSDQTVEALQVIAAIDPDAEYIALSRNYGHQIALTAGIDAAEGDAIVLMDGDLQHPPETVIEMVDAWLAGYDIVSAVRETTQDAGFFKRVSSNGFYWMINRLSDTKIATGVADFCLLSRKAHEAIKSMPERHRFLRGMVSWIGFKRAYLPYIAPPRLAGESKYNLTKMLHLALDATVSFSAAPLRLAMRTGLLVASVGAFYLTYTIGRYFVMGDLEPGWPSLLCTVLIIGGVQLVFVGILGEYLARIFEQVKGRPIYLVREASNEMGSQQSGSEAISAAEAEAQKKELTGHGSNS